MNRITDKLELIRICAEYAHETNRLYCVSIGDNSQPYWDKAPEWQKNSAIAGVQGVLLGNSPEQSHQGWLLQKQQDGWVYGEVKDPNATPPTHPCIMPYAQLSDEQRAKDTLFVSAVRLMANNIQLI